MITATFVQAIPEDYGKGAGPVYLRGNTCPVVMSRLFKHERKRLAAAFTVTGVRVHGNQAFVILGSQTQPATYLTLEHERSGWKLAGLLGIPVP